MSPPIAVPGIRLQWRSTDLLVVDFVHQVDDDEFAAYLGELDAVLGQRRRYATLCLHTGNWGLPASQRAMQLDFLRRRDRELALLCRGVGFVLPNAIPRLVLSSLLLLRRLPMPYAVFDGEAAASVWLASRAI